LPNKNSNILGRDFGSNLLDGLRFLLVCRLLLFYFCLYFLDMLLHYSVNFLINFFIRIERSLLGFVFGLILLYFLQTNLSLLSGRLFFNIMKFFCFTLLLRTALATLTILLYSRITHYTDWLFFITLILLFIFNFKHFFEIFDPMKRLLVK